MPSLRRASISSPYIRSTPYSHSPSYAPGQTTTATRPRRTASGTETTRRRVLADIEWWRVMHTQYPEHDENVNPVPANDNDNDNESGNDNENDQTEAQRLRAWRSVDLHTERLQRILRDVDEDGHTIRRDASDRPVWLSEEQRMTVALTEPFSALSISSDDAPSTASPSTLVSDAQYSDSQDEDDASLPSSPSVVNTSFLPSSPPSPILTRAWLDWHDQSELRLIAERSSATPSSPSSSSTFSTLSSRSDSIFHDPPTPFTSPSATPYTSPTISHFPDNHFSDTFSFSSIGCFAYSYTDRENGDLEGDLSREGMEDVQSSTAATIAGDARNSIAAPVPLAMPMTRSVTFAGFDTPRVAPFIVNDRERESFADLVF